MKFNERNTEKGLNFNKNTQLDHDYPHTAAKSYSSSENTISFNDLTAYILLMLRSGVWWLDPPLTTVDLDRFWEPSRLEFKGVRRWLAPFTTNECSRSEREFNCDLWLFMERESLDRLEEGEDLPLFEDLRCL